MTHKLTLLLISIIAPVLFAQIPPTAQSLNIKTVLTSEILPIHQDTSPQTKSSMQSLTLNIKPNSYCGVMLAPTLSIPTQKGLFPIVGFKTNYKAEGLTSWIKLETTNNTLSINTPNDFKGSITINLTFSDPRNNSGSLQIKLIADNNNTNQNFQLTASNTSQKQLNFFTLAYPVYNNPTIRNLDSILYIPHKSYLIDQCVSPWTTLVHLVSSHQSDEQIHNSNNAQPVLNQNQNVTIATDANVLPIKHNEIVQTRTDSTIINNQSEVPIFVPLPTLPTPQPYQPELPLIIPKAISTLSETSPTLNSPSTNSNDNSSLNLNANKNQNLFINPHVANLSFQNDPSQNGLNFNVSPLNNQPNHHTNTFTFSQNNNNLILSLAPKQNAQSEVHQAETVQTSKSLPKQTDSVLIQTGISQGVLSQSPTLQKSMQTHTNNTQSRTSNQVSKPTAVQTLTQSPLIKPELLSIANTTPDNLNQNSIIKVDNLSTFKPVKIQTGILKTENPLVVDTSNFSTISKYSNQPELPSTSVPNEIFPLPLKIQQISNTQTPKIETNYTNQASEANNHSSSNSSVSKSENSSFEPASKEQSDAQQLLNASLNSAPIKVSQSIKPINISQVIQGRTSPSAESKFTDLSQLKTQPVSPVVLQLPQTQPVSLVGLDIPLNSPTPITMTRPQPSFVEHPAVSSAINSVSLIDDSSSNVAKVASTESETKRTSTPVVVQKAINQVNAPTTAKSAESSKAV